jgi:hypothetical protein
MIVTGIPTFGLSIAEAADLAADVAVEAIDVVVITCSQL